MAMASGIYEIRNTVTGRRYVGQSVNVRKRIGGHFSALSAGTHPCRYLQFAFKKHGRAAFTWRTVEAVIAHDLDEAEQRWLDAGFAAGDLYNSDRVAKRSPRGTRRTDKSKAMLSARQKALFADPAWKAMNMARRSAGYTDEWRDKLRAKALSDVARSARMREVSIKRFAGEDGKAEHARLMEKRSKNRAWLDAVQNRCRSWRSDPGVVSRHAAAVKASSMTARWRERNAAHRRRMADDPAWHAAMERSHRSESARANHGAASRRYWDELKKDPDAYAAVRARMSAATKRFAAENPEAAAKRQTAAQAARITKRAAGGVTSG